MYIKFIILLIFLQTSMNVCGKVNNYFMIENRNDTISQLHSAYVNKDYDTFFALFPNTFRKFLTYYGYEHDIPAPLYDCAPYHIDYLFSNHLNADRQHINKLVDIAKEASWDADAPNFLQKHLRKLILQYPVLFLDVLNEKTSKEIENFWYFILYYPSLHSNNDLQYRKLKEQLYKSMKTFNPDMGKVVNKIMIQLDNKE